MSIYTDHLAPAEPGIGDMLSTGPWAVVQPVREDESIKSSTDYSGCECAACCAAARDNAPPLHSAPDLVPATTATSFSIAVGGSVETSIDTLGDHDWYSVSLVAGQTYTIHSSAVFGSNPDTFLNLRNSAGLVIASDDDSGDNTYSLISFTATTTGTYFVDAGTFNDASTGSYRISVASGFTGGDIAGSTATTGAIAIGGSVNGSIGASGDRDWYAVTLTAGETYLFRTGGTTATTTTDTLLTLRDSAGVQLATNDDAGEDTFSAVRFTATTGGTYYLDVGAFGSGTGAFNLTAFTTSPLTVYTNDQIAFQLTDTYWGGARHAFNVAPGGSITYNLTALTAAGQTLAREAFALWTDATGIVFTETAGAGQITLDDAQEGAFATASYSGGITSSANVNIGTGWLTTYGTGLNSYSFQTYIHEIGHTLGLGHGGNYNGAAGYASDALYSNDSWASTVMSYFDQLDNSYTAGLGYTRQFTVTPMVADAVATTVLYGTNTLTRTGDTTYGFNNTSGRAIYDATANPAVGYTVYDNGGIDTLDYSGFAQNQRINLNAESYSSTGTQVANVWIARGAVIENAIGGTGNDTIIGNAAANALTGNNGNDSFTGGLGADVINGGAGTDTASYDDNHGAVFVNLASGQGFGNAAQGDTFSGIENVTGSAFGDYLIGDAGSNVLNGGEGDDYLSGFLGADTLVGGNGSDTTAYEGAGGGVFINLASGQGFNNSAQGDSFSSIENVIGGADADFVIGDGGANVLNGGNGNDILIGGLGADTLIGGGGSDTASYEDNQGAVFVNLLGSVGTGNAAQGDSYSGIENVNGTAFQDSLFGDNSDNILDGMAGNDILGGNGGADVFRVGSGVDTINDFISGSDRIALNGALFTRTATVDFRSGAGAQSATSANSAFLYNTTNGQLSYDADGNGAGGAVLVAVLQGNPALQGADLIFY